MLHDEAIAWAVRLTRDRSAAEDVVQEAFLNVFSRVRALPDDEATRRYLSRAVTNAALSRLRSEHRRHAREASASNLPSSAVEVDEELWQLVQRLPKRLLTALMYRFWLDQSEVETARLMRCRVGTVKSLTSRAISTLRNEVKRA